MLVEALDEVGVRVVLDELLPGDRVGVHEGGGALADHLRLKGAGVLDGARDVLDAVGECTKVAEHAAAGALGVQAHLERVAVGRGLELGLDCGRLELDAAGGGEDDVLDGGALGGQLLLHVVDLLVLLGDRLVRLAVGRHLSPVDLVEVAPVTLAEAPVTEAATVDRAYRGAVAVAVRVVVRVARAVVRVARVVRRGGLGLQLQRLDLLLLRREGGLQGRELGGAVDARHVSHLAVDGGLDAHLHLGGVLLLRGAQPREVVAHAAVDLGVALLGQLDEVQAEGLVGHFAVRAPEVLDDGADLVEDGVHVLVGGLRREARQDEFLVLVPVVLDQGVVACGAAEALVEHRVGARRVVHVLVLVGVDARELGDQHVVVDAVDE